ncbi:MAG TPA: MMPL family transporter [Myxococcota bacterium]
MPEPTRVILSPQILFTLVAGALLVAGLAFASLRPGAVVGHPRRVLSLVALVSAAALLALVRLDPPGLRLVIDPSTEPMLPASDPAKEDYRAAVRDFGDDEVFVIAMETADVFTAENLGALRRLSDRIAKLPEVREVKSLVRVTSFRWVPADEWIEIRPLVEEIPSDPAALAALRARALGDPLFRRTLVSDDGRTAALNVSFRKMTDREFITADLDGRIQRLVAEERQPGRRFHVAGRPHVKSQVYHLMMRDLALLMPLAVAGIAAVLTFCLGSWRGVVLPMASVLIATLWTFGAIALLGRPLTILTVILAPNLIAIGSVYGVHVITRYEEEGLSVADSPAAALRCLEHITTPVLISGLTTAIGFGALLVTDVPAVYELGAFSVLGVASVTLLSISAVPAALALLPLPARAARPGFVRRASARIQAGFGAVLRVFNHSSARYSRSVIAVWALLSLLAACLVPRMRVDTDYLSFFDERSQVRRDFEAVNRLLSGAVPIYVVIGGDGSGAMREPEALRAVERLEREVEKLPGVTHATSIVEVVRALNRAVEAGDPAQERIPETRAGVAELLQLVPKGDAQRLLTTDHARANLIVRTGTVGSEAVRALAASLERSAAAAQLPAPLTSIVTGNAILLSRSADGIASGQMQAVCLAAGSIFLLILAGLRSLPLAVIAMIPNVVPVLLFFGLLGAGIAPLSLPTSLIGSVALGIAIDDTVHYIVRYRAERMAGRDPDQASRQASQSVGTAIVTTCAMLVAGYSIIALSGFATLREFGLLSAGTMLLCLVTDLILLPALLMRWRV